MERRRTRPGAVTPSPVGAGAAATRIRASDHRGRRGHGRPPRGRRGLHGGARRAPPGASPGRVRAGRAPRSRSSESARPFDADDSSGSMRTIRRVSSDIGPSACESSGRTRTRRRSGRSRGRAMFTRLLAIATSPERNCRGSSNCGDLASETKLTEHHLTPYLVPRRTILRALAPSRGRGRGRSAALVDPPRRGAAAPASLAEPVPAPTAPCRPRPRSLRPDLPHLPRRRNDARTASADRKRRGVAPLTPTPAAPAPRTATRAPPSRGAPGSGRSPRGP